MKLGKLVQKGLRDVWKHEALDFTKWLAEGENLQTLGEEVGLEINLIEIESGVGKFSVDILASEETSGKKIVIENQLEATDHGHLGQILTYAAGVEADFLIWVVSDAREEHKQAVDWLNERTDDKVNFFLVQIEVWQIGQSDLAPRFNVVCRPNNWTKSVRAASNASQSLSETKLAQFEFWKQFVDFAKSSQPSVKLRKAQPQHWHDMAIGTSECHVAYIVSFDESKVSVELYIPDSKPLFEKLHGKKQAIETACDLGPLSWQPLPGKKASRVRLSAPFDLDAGRSDAFAWLLSTGQKFRSCFMAAINS